MGREIIKLRVWDILEQRGMTGKELAAKMGVKNTYLYNILGKSKTLSINALVNIAEALGVEFSELFVPPTNLRNNALDSLKRLLVSEISFPDNASVRTVGFLLDAVKENMSHEEWMDFLNAHVKGAMTKPLLDKCRVLMKSETADDVEFVIA